MFITFEGPEGSGKTTQMNQLAAWLREQGYDVLTTREPGGTAIGDRIRAILLDPVATEMEPETEALLFSAARAQHVRQVILPYLRRPLGIVLCDRFADSTLAYQGYGHGLDLAQLAVITAFATAGLHPDLTVYLDLEVEVGLRRKALASGQDAAQWNRMEQRALAYHRRVRDGYLAMVAAEPQRWLVVDASQPLEEVQAQIRQGLAPRLPALSR